MKYSAEDFMHGTPPRAGGTETEYNVSHIDMLSLTGNTVNANIQPPARALIPDRQIGGSSWLTNGARLYIDYGRLLEYATPEVDNAHDLLLHELVGERIVDDIIIKLEGETEKRQALVYKRAGYTLIEGITEPGSAGHHENYFTATLRSPERNLPAALAMKSFLATRIIWSGTGMVTSQGYEISQKSMAIAFEGGSNQIAHGQKPALSYKDSTRLEVRTGEGNMSQWAIIQKFAMTSLVLRLVEHGVFPEDLIIKLDSQRRIFQDTSRNPLTVIATQYGDVMSATEHQRRIAQACIEFCAANPGTPKDELAAAQEILKVCTDVEQSSLRRGEVSALSDRVDWAAKYALILSRDIRPFDIRGENRLALMCDLKWEDIAKRGLSRLWYAQNGGPVYINEKEFPHGMKTPPATTRARKRVKAIKIPGQRVKSIDWSRVELEGAEDTDSTIFYENDPHQSR